MNLQVKDSISDDLTNAAIPNLLLRVWKHVKKRRQVQFVFLVGLMLMNAAAQVFSLGAVLPFLSVFVAPERTFEYPIVREISLAWGITSAEQLILPLTVAFIVMALIAGAFQMLVLWTTNNRVSC